jgi:hypothetical protein
VEKMCKRHEHFTKEEILMDYVSDQGNGNKVPIHTEDI